MSETSDTSNSSVIFVAEQKSVHVEVHPPPPSPNNTSEAGTTNGDNLVPDTKGDTNNSSKSTNDIFEIPETGK